MEDPADPVATMAAELRRLGVDHAAIRAACEATRAQWGGGQAYIRAVDREARDQRIEDLLNRGVSAGRIAREVGVHPSTIRRRRSKWL
jgi:AraC-like DNA-binding protein